MTTATATTYTSFEAFKAEALSRGFDEVLERNWAPNTVLEEHTHAFGVWAQVIRGEFWLTVGNTVKHMPTSAQFTLDANVPHAERYGAEGASYWVARRNG